MLGTKTRSYWWQQQGAQADQQAYEDQCRAYMGSSMFPNSMITVLNTETTAENDNLLLLLEEDEV